MPTIRKYGSIGEVPSALWDSLAAQHDINYSQPYLSFREATEPGRSVVLISSDEAGRAVGAVVAYMTTDDTPFFNHPIRFITSTQVLREGESGPSIAPSIPPETLEAFRRCAPTLVVTNLGDSRVLLHPTLTGSQRREVIRELIAHLNREASEIGCGSTAFLYAHGDDADLVAALREQQFQLAMCSSRADIDLSRAESRTAYLTTLPPSKRRAMEREIRQFTDNSLSIRQLDPPERYVEEIAALELQTYARHGVALSAEDVRTRLLLQIEHTGNASRLMGCFEGTRLVATAVDFVGRDQYFCTTYGQDHKAVARKYTYQMMSFHDPIEYACQSDLKAVYLGIEALQAKLRRGAIAKPLYLAFRPAEESLEIESWLDHIDERNHRYLVEMIERFGSQGATRPEAWLACAGGDEDGP